MVELNLEIPGLNTAVVEYTPLCEVRLDSSRNKAPHVDEGRRNGTKEDSLVAEEHLVCAVDAKSCAKLKIKKRAGAKKSSQTN